jgi:hypothetical protein
MSFHPHGVPPDDPSLEIYEHAHGIDHDMSSTNLGISIHRAAVAAGHPEDPQAARKAVRGPAGAAAVQATMNPYVEDAIKVDGAAAQYAAEALDRACHARSVAEQRSRLPDEHVPLADGSSQTRGQVQAGQAERMEAAAQRVGRGDTEHQADKPGLEYRLTVAAVLSVIELGLLIWPVTNASWADPASVAYVVGLAVMFLLMNDQLPAHAGRAWREYREALHAARELTSVAVSRGRAGDLDAGREIAGHVDSRHVGGRRRHAICLSALLGVVLAVYAAVMFTRVLRLAGPLGSSTFSVLAAALITAFTVGAPILLAHRWSRGNALGDELREFGAVTAESTEIAQHLQDLAEEAIATAEQLTELAHDQLERASQVIQDGSRVVAVGLQKAARMLALDSVLIPDAENLFPAERALRTRAIDTIARTVAVIADVRRDLSEPGPFAPDGPAPSPWRHRAARRQAVPNPAYLDPSQTGPLHQPTHARRPGG